MFVICLESACELETDRERMQTIRHGAMRIEPSYFIQIIFFGLTFL